MVVPKLWNKFLWNDSIFKVPKDSVLFLIHETSISPFLVNAFRLILDSKILSLAFISISYKEEVAGGREWRM